MAAPWGGEPALLEALVGAAEAVVRSGRWVKGPEAEAFAAEVAASCGVGHGVACTSGTQALVIALLALGVGPGDEVVVPAWTFTATATAVRSVGAEVVFSEVDRRTHGLAAVDVAARIGPRTRAVIAVHLFGIPVAREVFEVCAEAGVPVVEDVAQAHGAMLGGRPVGSLGALAALSFFPAKNVGVVGDGGAVVTDDAGLGARVARLVDHGRDASGQPVELGSNWRMGEIQGATGRVLLRRHADWMDRRRVVAGRMSWGLSGVAGIELPQVPEEGVAAWNTLPIAVEAPDRVVEALAARGVASARHYRVPVHLQPVFAGHPQAVEGALPVTEALSQRTLSLPCHVGLSDAQVEQVVVVVIEAVAGRST